jgi:hypothetical protein
MFAGLAELSSRLKAACLSLLLYKMVYKISLKKNI